jgi:hypothetical protein
MPQQMQPWNTRVEAQACDAIRFCASYLVGLALQKPNRRRSWVGAFTREPTFNE